MTHTHATLEVSNEAFKEIYDKLKAAGYYEHVFINSAGAMKIDMTGIAVAPYPPWVPGRDTVKDVKGEVQLEEKSDTFLTPERLAGFQTLKDSKLLRGLIEYVSDLRCPHCGREIRTEFDI